VASFVSARHSHVLRVGAQGCQEIPVKKWKVSRRKSESEPGSVHAVRDFVRGEKEVKDDRKLPRKCIVMPSGRNERREQRQ
jgi:hypothetical protein